LDEYTAVKPLLDEAIAKSDIGFAAVYDSNRISIILNSVLNPEAENENEAIWGAICI
jgi:hypothetical protein